MAETQDERIEKIGKIRLNLAHYSGEDLYCDGDVEDELLEIARNYSTVEYQRIIEEKKSWPILYHLSPLRENIVEWLPITKEMKVLEVGAGCGAITGVLARKAGEVTCIELSKKRSLINAHRHMDCDNVTIHVGNFQEIEPDLPCDYDYICLIGVFEYGQAYIQSEHPYEDFLSIVGKHKKAEGHIAVAIENKFGLKYWAGCKEDHLGTYFSGLEDYPEGGVVRTFTKNGLLSIADKCGFDEVRMYYPYPDYKFMTSLYSDVYLPRLGELSLNNRNFDRDRLFLFDERRVFDTILKEGQFPLFSNSYLMLLGPGLDTQYVKYSNDRAPEFGIKTQIVERDGREIQKRALSEVAAEHIKNTYRAYEKLQKRYEGGKLAVNRCILREGEESPYLCLEFIEGRSLEEYLDERLFQGDTQGFYELFDEYLERIAYHEEAEIADYDLIFANILVEEEKDTPVRKRRWSVIDYEWSFDEALETKEIAFRAVYCYLLADEKRNRLDFSAILDRLSISAQDAEQYRRKEMKFQKQVTGKYLSMAEMRDAIGHPAYSLEAFCEGQERLKRQDKIQVYEDTGRGFCEEQSFFLEEAAEGQVELAVTVQGGRSAVRIDPGNASCMIYIKEILWNMTPVSLKGKQVQLNGFKVGEQTYAFATDDPNITLFLGNLANQEKNLLQVNMEVTRLPKETVEHMKKRGLF